MIEVRDLVKSYGGRRVLDGLTFTAEPGRVTAFLGPNGAGKSTTLRMILGLGIPDAGHALVNGVRYAELRDPLRTVGALLDASACHPARSPRAHLTWLARTQRIPAARVDEVLGLVGLAPAARRPVRGFSLGMRQRLGIAVALLGDPGTVILDEPMNGLDPEGIQWLRGLLRALADEGRTVLVSSHLMREMAVVADQVLVIGRGRVLADGGLTEFLETDLPPVRLVTPRLDELSRALRAEGARVTHDSDPHRATVTGLTSARIGDIAAQNAWSVHELTPVRPSLEEAYMRLTAEAVEYRSATAASTKKEAASHASLK
ncbi:ATP-binding cassette domain-containing protein [Streptomyces sp. GXMU-J15]|uniref:ATP-binding cassette domain-containing protein n=1 Tax=Streptomyces fuscus TaxID=3048495 RepID=A0ABT7J1E6_9ACTN|nr:MULTISPECIES: ATP-binding cassette domain-containing protein [Streptomyces]MDL2078685.1 ATP-binding cassette domain-containing protein [Streptomyces fuscus]SBT90110.1 ABC-2 type transport system ATP-binding protein [Streptomyces sp. DI166]